MPLLKNIKRITVNNYMAMYLMTEKNKIIFSKYKLSTLTQEKLDNLNISVPIKNTECGFKAFHKEYFRPE